MHCGHAAYSCLNLPQQTAKGKLSPRARKSGVLTSQWEIHVCIISQQAHPTFVNDATQTCRWCFSNELPGERRGSLLRPLTPPDCWKGGGGRTHTPSRLKIENKRGALSKSLHIKTQQVFAFSVFCLLHQNVCSVASNSCVVWKHVSIWEHSSVRIFLKRGRGESAGPFTGWLSSPATAETQQQRHNSRDLSVYSHRCLNSLLCSHCDGSIMRFFFPLWKLPTYCACSSWNTVDFSLFQ